MKKLIVLVLIVASMILLSSCDNSINFGTITEKKYEPAHRSYAPFVQIMNKRTRIVPRWINHPDKWFVLVQNNSDSEWWEVSEEYYNTHNVGDEVDRR